MFSISQDPKLKKKPLY